jgi:hypothetical protein
LTSILCQGTYPTLIIILVHLDYTIWEQSGSGTTITISTPVFSTIPPSVESVMVLSPNNDNDNDKEKGRRW